MDIKKSLKGKELKHHVFQMDGFECSCIGFDEINCRLNYSLNLIISKLTKDGMSYSEAMEYYLFNIESSLGGPGMPFVIDDVF